MRDLQTDVALLKTQLAVMPIPASRANAALYTCDRLALAQKELTQDANAQSLLGEADSLCAYKAPLAAAGARLAEGKPDCLGLRDVLGRVGVKYRNDAQVEAVVTTFKGSCPKVRLFAARSSSRSTSPSAPDTSGQRDACKKRCDDAAFSCRSSCQYCGSCTTDKTWEWCNATCNNCKQGCEQNEKFCQSACGS